MPRCGRVACEVVLRAGLAGHVADVRGQARSCRHTRGRDPLLRRIPLSSRLDGRDDTDAEQHQRRDDNPLHRRVQHCGAIHQAGDHQDDSNR